MALSQNYETTKYLKTLGVKNIVNTGNIKYYGEKNNKKQNLLIKKNLKILKYGVQLVHIMVKN